MRNNAAIEFQNIILNLCYGNLEKGFDKGLNRINIGVSNNKEGGDQFVPPPNRIKVKNKLLLI